MWSWVWRNNFTTGGSISRPRAGIFREAADIAYHFKWAKSEIMGMTKKERIEWLMQINRIQTEERKQRLIDSQDEIDRIMQAKNEYME